MQQAVLHHFPDSEATYRFTHRDRDVFFTRKSIDEFKVAVARAHHLWTASFIRTERIHYIEFSSLSITDTELEWLKKTCPYFKPQYLDYLSKYKFKPEQIHIEFVPVSDDGYYGHVDIEATGLWVETIMWEVPLMACLSEIYFCSVSTDWTLEGQDGRRIFLLHRSLS